MYFTSKKENPIFLYPPIPLPYSTSSRNFRIFHFPFPRWSHVLRTSSMWRNIIIAHRGTEFLTPEESEAATRWARNMGADYLERDLQRWLREMLKAIISEYFKSPILLIMAIVREYPSKQKLLSYFPVWQLHLKNVWKRTVGMRITLMIWKKSSTIWVLRLFSTTSSSFTEPIERLSISPARRKSLISRNNSTLPAIVPAAILPLQVTGFPRDSIAILHGKTKGWEKKVQSVQR